MAVQGAGGGGGVGENGLSLSLSSSFLALLLPPFACVQLLQLSVSPLTLPQGHTGRSLRDHFHTPAQPGQP